MRRRLPGALRRRSLGAVTDIVTIDCGYMGFEAYAAAYLLVQGDEAAFIENNTHHAVPRLLDALAAAGLTPEQVRYIIITHVHLDHAGGTSTLAKACPNATVLAHPRAARHVIDPTKLVNSATSVYGEERFERLYGRITPVPEARVRSLEDEEAVSLNGRRLTFLHTRGHANHHFCVVDPQTGSLFSGDAFGLVYPALQDPGTFAVPSTSPTDFDAELARQSIRRVVECAPRRVFPTHYGEVRDIETVAAQLTRHLDRAEAIMLDAERSDLPDEALTDYCQLRLRDYFAGLLDRHGLGAVPEAWRLLETDIDLNAQGLAFAANKRRKKAREAAAG